MKKEINAMMDTKGLLNGGWIGEESFSSTYMYNNDFINGMYERISFI